MTMHRVRIAGDIKFFAATEDKKAVAYVNLVEDRQKRHPDGTYTEADPNWFDGTFRGGWAEALNEGYRSGDAILVDAEIEKHSFQKEGGEITRSSKMFVAAFGPDAIRARVSIDRTPRAEREARPAQQVATEAEADQESDRDSAQSDARVLPLPREAEDRLTSLIDRVDRIQNYESEVFDQIEAGAGDGLRTEADQLIEEADQIVKPFGFRNYVEYLEARDSWSAGGEYFLQPSPALNQASTNADRDPRDAPNAPSRAQIESDLYGRLNQLVEANRISPAAATQVMDVYLEYKHSDSELLSRAVFDSAKSTLPAVEAHWVSTVPLTLVTGNEPLDWNAAERVVQANQQHAPAPKVDTPTFTPAL